MGFCNCSMFCCALLCVHSSFAIISMGKRELAALLSLSSWCLMSVVWLFLTLPWVCLQFVIMVFPDRTHLLFLIRTCLFYTLKYMYGTYIITILLFQSKLKINRELYIFIVYNFRDQYDEK